MRFTIFQIGKSAKMKQILWTEFQDFLTVTMVIPEVKVGQPFLVDIDVRALKNMVSSKCVIKSFAKHTATASNIDFFHLIIQSLYYNLDPFDPMNRSYS